MLLLATFGASADDCFTLYAKSGATQGSPTCKIDVTSNTPGGMGNYACINDLALIDQWCKATDNPSDDSCPVADPVFPANGNVMLFEVDFASGDTSPIVLSRTYLSKPYDKTQSAMGAYWVNNWQRRLDLSAVSASTPKIVAYRGDGQPLTFKWISGAWAVPGTPGLSLAKAGDGYFYLKDELLGTTEGYSDTTGKFYSETTRTGVIRKIFYDGRQRLSEIVWWPVDNVIPATANLIRFEYDDDSDRIVTLVDPLGMPTFYSYDGKGNLASVTAPYGHVRQYLYEDARFPNALTGVKDDPVRGLQLGPTIPADVQSRSPIPTRHGMCRSATLPARRRLAPWPATAPTFLMPEAPCVPGQLLHQLARCRGRGMRRGT
jgi:YD repeat-containing protein